jgi:flagellar basal-body rod modification protein FlgD
MMNIKGGTQTWSNAPQRTDFKSDGNQNVNAIDKEKLMNGESVGDLLNKVADPNFVDTTKKMRTVGNNQLGKDAFMSLLLTQMKNQDPTNPLKSHEMAAQLAQFTSLEKLHNINESVEGLRKDNQPNHNFQALSFIGKSITTDNSKISRVDTISHHDVRFILGADAQKITMSIKDADGGVIRKLEFNGLKQGKNEINWNGMTEDGREAPTGDYTIAFEAVGSNGHKIAVETRTEGTISGVNFTPKGPQLMIGKQVVNMADVKSISDPNLAPPPPANVLPTGTGPLPVPKDSKHPAKPETKENEEKRAKIAKGSLNDAAMAQGLINKLNKEGAKAGMEGGGT